MNEDVPELPEPSNFYGAMSRKYILAYGRACFLAGMERAAVMADAVADGYSSHDAESWGANACAAAIRAEIEAQPRA